MFDHFVGLVIKGLILHFLQYDPEEVRVLTNLLFLVLGPLMLAATFFFIFEQPLSDGFLHNYEIHFKKSHEEITLQEEPLSNIIFVEYVLQIKIKS